METPEPLFHFLTLVTRDDQYGAMRESLAAAGFDGVSRYEVLDNRGGNAHEPYAALTRAIQEAQAPYVVFCHQDLLFREPPEKLLQALRALDELDPQWALAGNAGCTPELNAVFCVDDHVGPQDVGVRPSRVLSLDENFLVVRRGSGLACSPGLSGFHLYATDLCLNAYEAGRSAYVVEYRLTHLGSSLDYAGLYQVAQDFARAWRSRIGGAALLTPAGVVVLAPVAAFYPFLVRTRIAGKLLWHPTLLRLLNLMLRPWRPRWLPMR